MAKGYIFDKLLNRKIEGETDLTSVNGINDIVKEADEEGLGATSLAEYVETVSSNIMHHQDELDALKQNVPSIWMLDEEFNHYQPESSLPVEETKLGDIVIDKYGYIGQITNKYTDGEDYSLTIRGMRETSVAEVYYIKDGDNLVVDDYVEYNFGTKIYEHIISFNDVESTVIHIFSASINTAITGTQNLINLYNSSLHAYIVVAPDNYSSNVSAFYIFNNNAYISYVLQAYIGTPQTVNNMAVVDATQYTDVCYGI